MVRSSSTESRPFLLLRSAACEGGEALLTSKFLLAILTIFEGFPDNIDLSVVQKEEQRKATEHSQDGNATKMVFV